MRSLIVAALALAAAATPAFAGDLAPPAPDGAVAVTADQAGQTITASVGDKIAVELIGSPSTGTSWLVAEKPDFLGAPQFATGPTSDAQTRPGFVGGDRWQVYVFDVTTAGSATLKLEKRSPATRTGAPLETFQVTVEAQ